LRVPNEIKLNVGTSLKNASGRNLNPFFQVEETPVPVISEKATITTPDLKPTFLYDLPTQAGKTYTFVSR